ncbi:MAG TPA: tetratricopeptide repeat protein, partial [Pyrinomonadaceae bacterium]|nr:tetratricopeptide repeat protein [Pyrinomonadaceae bacterium]
GGSDLYGSAKALVAGGETALLALLQEKSDEPKKIWEQAQALFALAQFDAALVSLAQLAENPEVNELRRRCYDHLARWAIEVGDLSSAEWATEQYLREDESSFHAWALCGEVASLRDDDAAALDYYSRALTVLPRDYSSTPAQAYQVNHLLYLRVSTLVRLQRYEEALEHWRAVIKRNDANADLWYLGALCTAQLGRTVEALPLCRRALELDKQHIDAAKLRQRLEAK